MLGEGSHAVTDSAIWGLAILAAFVLATFLFVRGRLPLSGRIGDSVNLIRTDREAEAFPAWHRA